jgi:HD domain/Domain of unknown function (DUF4118)
MDVNPTKPQAIWLRRELIILLAVVVVTGIIHFLVVPQRAFLNFYYLPVVLGAYWLGLRSGVFSALLCVMMVTAIALMNDGQFVAVAAEGWQRWVDLGTWGCFLVLTAYLVGRMYEQKERRMRDVRDAYASILEIMTSLIDSVDRDGQHHARRVAEMSTEIARGMKIADTDIDDIRVAAWLHDVGKVDLSLDVLTKAIRLPADVAASAAIESTRRGRSSDDVLRNVIPIVACHQERWDGAGLHRMAGERIPLGARIIAVAETYDAVVMDRPYRKGRTHEEAVAILKQGSGAQFDPQVVEAFLRTYANARPQLAVA